jgi:4-amino-4-deoxy-L-arabinose transferase-like glycosyltransferase
MTEAHQDASGARPPRRRTLYALGAVAAVSALALVLLLHRLGAADVCSGNEAIEGVFVQQMVEHGRYLFPLENGRYPMYKPPLFHWTATALDRAFGFRKVTGFNLRLPSVLYATAGVALVMLFANGILGLDGALLAGLTLAASYQYVSQGRYGRVDMTLTFFETLALFSFFWWTHPARPESAGADGATTGREAMQYVCAAAIGLGVLAKGPVGAIIPLAAIAIYVVTNRRWREVLSRLSPLAVVLAILIATSWYAACYIGGRYGFLDRQIESENVGRFFGSLGTMAPWYYVVPLLLNSAPLSLLVPVAVVAALMPRRKAASAPGMPGEERTRAAVRLMAIFWLVTVVFFSIAAYKRRAYLLPLWPAAAVMLAWMVKAAAAKMRSRAAPWLYGALCAGLIVFNFVFIPNKETRDCGGDSLRPAAEEIKRVVGPSDPLYLYGFREEVAPLLFYLDRNAPEIGGKLGDAPPGYIIVPAAVWAKKQGEALDLAPVLESSHGNEHLILLRHGKLYACSE